MVPPLKIIVVILILVFLSACPARSRQSQVDREHQLAAIIDLGLVALKTGDYAKALVSFNEANRLSPNNPDVLHHIGRTYFQLGEFEKAIEYYNTALALDPTKTDIHNNLGILYMSIKDFDKAKMEFQYCIDDHTYGNSDMSRYNMGLLEESQGRMDLAKNYYQQLISSDSVLIQMAYYRMGFLYSKEQDYRTSLDYLSLAVRMNPDYTDAYFLMGEVLEKLGNNDEAAEAYGRCVTLEPNSMRGIEAQRRVRAIMHEYK
ncbi:MAG: tetratricopeptide repeat protein [Deltaproteobacteria bacterium]|jgi:Tfp pilus assembly protein PilF|nr:tetratricopeptide repeat protein [Deltaproteobacteria bacterium]